MIWWDHLVEVKRIEKLSLLAFPTTHHAAAPADAISKGITDRESSQREFCNSIGCTADVGFCAAMSGFDAERSFVIDTPILLTAGVIASIEACDAHVSSGPVRPARRAQPAPDRSSPATLLSGPASAGCRHRGICRACLRSSI